MTSLVCPARGRHVLAHIGPGLDAAVAAQTRATPGTVVCGRVSRSPRDGRRCRRHGAAARLRPMPAVPRPRRVIERSAEGVQLRQPAATEQRTPVNLACFWPSASEWPNHCSFGP